MSTTLLINKDAPPTPDLTGRTARCAYFAKCGREVPSSDKLWYFKFRGVGSDDANNICGECNTHHMAHDRALAGIVSPAWRTVIESGECTGFRPHGPFAHDEYYCGCNGTD